MQFFFFSFKEEFYTNTVWSNITKAKSKTSICNTFCVHEKSHSLSGQIFNRSLSSSVYLSLLSFGIMCHWDVKGKKKKKRSARIPTPPLHVCDVIITHIKGCALNTATVSFPGGVIKNEQSKLSWACQKRIKTSPHARGRKSGCARRRTCMHELTQECTQKQVSAAESAYTAHLHMNMKSFFGGREGGGMSHFPR